MDYEVDSNRMKIQKTIGWLPSELLSEVFKRLPVTTLLKLRFVCKSWNSLISDPIFHQDRLHQFRKKNNQDYNNYILSCEHRDLPTMNVRNSQTLQIIDKIDLGKFRNGINSIVGYVDGVLLIHISSPKVNNGANVIFLWNPTIGKIVEIPPYESLKKSRDVNFGFGFDSVSNVYKVVAVNLKYYETKTKIYNLSSRSWTSPKQTSCFIDNVVYLSKSSRTINFKGGIYWLARGEAKGKRLTHYLRFNLSSETFNCVKLPDFKPEPGLNQRWRRLSVLYESIALVDCSGWHSLGHVRIWVTRKDITKKADSWVELYKLDLPRKSLVFLKNNGDVYLRRARTILVYDLETMEEKGKTETNGEITFIDDYTESLVLLGQPSNKLFRLVFKQISQRM